MRQSVRLTGLLVLCVAVSAAQAPVVSVDHPGPPVCTPDAQPAANPASRMTVGKALAIEQAAGSDPTMLVAFEPLENFQLTRYRLAEYDDCVGDSGCYWADIDAQYKRAEGALDRQLATRKRGEKLALAFDVDETATTGYCEMKREDYGFIKSLNNEWIVSPAASVAIPGAVRLFNRAKAAGVDIFFITGRPQEQLEATARNLEAAGYHGWKGLFLRDEQEKKLSIIAYKSGRRKQIVGEGYRLILNVGDQWSDLTGEPKAEISVKLPNPFYFLP